MSAPASVVNWSSFATAQPLKYRSVDVMKLTKDVVRNQPSDEAIQRVVASLASLNATHIAISIPLDPTADYPNPPPAPRTAEAFTQVWADTIHSAGLHVMFRGDWNGLEGNYGFVPLVGQQRLAPSQWLTRISREIMNNPNYFQAGDIWAPMPERTERIFWDQSSFLSFGSPGIQDNYADFFNEAADVAANAFARIEKRGVIVGLTSNNFTEVDSGWIPQSMFDKAAETVVDHYGSTHTPREMDGDLRRIYATRGYPILLQEWGDHWNGGMSRAERTAYVRSMYAVWRELAAEGKLAGFNYWGGWPGAVESILNPDYSVNYLGRELAAFYR